MMREKPDICMTTIAVAFFVDVWPRNDATDPNNIVLILNNIYIITNALIIIQVDIMNPTCRKLQLVGRGLSRIKFTSARTLEESQVREVHMFFYYCEIVAATDCSRDHLGTMDFPTKYNISCNIEE